MRTVILALLLDTSLFAACLFAGQNDVVCPVQTAGQPLAPGTTITLKIVLVEFSEVTCKKLPGTSTPKFSKADFEDMLGSSQPYLSQTQDGDAVHGSMSDYFEAMSNNQINIQATLTNNIDPVTNKPVWLLLRDPSNNPRTKASFTLISYSASPIWGDVDRAAAESGLNISVSNPNERLVIIYAGNTCFEFKGLNPMYDGLLTGKRYIMSELQGTPYGQENPTTDKFARIGFHCHEFGHTIGAEHCSGSRAELMEAGARNGDVVGNAPAPLSAVNRVKLGWVDTVGVVTAHPETMTYSLKTPTVYCIYSSANSDYFLIEHRRFNQNMTIDGVTTPDYNYYMPIAMAQNYLGDPEKLTQGILIWRVRGVYPNGNYNDNGLVYASGLYGQSYPDHNPTETDAGDLFPGKSNNRLFTPWTDPRNPYIQVGSTWSVYVPNSKPGTNVGVEILSVDDYAGSIQVYLMPNAGNPASANQSTMATATQGNNQRKLYRESSGTTLHEVFEHGGEVFYRKSTDDGSTWSVTSQLTTANMGGNSSPSITGRGSYLYVVWQMTNNSSGQVRWDVVYSYSTNGGTAWRANGPVTLRSALTTPSPGPKPSVQASTPSASNEIMIAWRDATQLKAGHTPSTMPGAGSWTITTVAGSNSVAENPTLVYKPNDPPAWRCVWNGSGTIYHQPYSSGTWLTLVSFCPPWAGNTAPSAAVTGNNDLHLVWQGTNMGPCIVDNKNLNSSIFTKFGGSVPYYFSPTVTGHSAARTSLLWYDADNNVKKVLYDGSAWLSITNIATGAKYVNASLTNPPGGSAWTLWTTTSGPPYTVQRGPTSILSKTSGEEETELEYSRQLALVDTSLGSVLALTVGEPEINFADGSRSRLSFVLVDDTREYDLAGLAALLETQPFALPRSPSSISQRYSLCTGATGQRLSPALTGDFTVELVSTQSGATLSSQTISAAAAEAQGIAEGSVLLGVQGTGERATLRIRRAKLESPVRGYLIHQYTPVEGRGLDKDSHGRTPDGALADKPPEFGLVPAYPNPFNPSTHLDFQLPENGHVSLVIYDLLGQTVATLVEGYRPAGYYSASWSATKASSGIYFARLSVSDNLGQMKFTKVNKLLLTR